MLKKLVIDNFILITHSEINFNHGLSVLTGESGAGKSILIDALLLLLGNRMTHSIIREGEEKTTLKGVFEISKLSLAYEWLNTEEFLKNQELICELKREINLQGKSKCWINGKSASLNKLKQIAELLIDIHGQHAHQTLLKSDHQRNLLDEFAQHQELVNSVEFAYEQWQFTIKRKASLLQQLEQSEFLKHQLTQKLETWKEFQHTKQELGLKDYLWQEILDYHERLSHSEMLAENCKKSYELLNGEENQRFRSSRNAQKSALYLIDEIRSHLVEIARYDERKINNLIQYFDQAEIQLQEAVYELTDYRKTLTYDPDYLSQLHDYINSIERFAYQQQTTPELLNESIERWQFDLDHIPTEDDIVQINKEINKLYDDYVAIAQELSESRKNAIPILNQEITAFIRKLAMPHAKFEIQLQKLTQPNRFGIEQVIFTIRIHDQASPKALSKVASGGELSRISLAIQAIISQQHSASTIIFDEVDVGISGATAEQVGQLLRQLSLQRQVLCITHLPQVAVCGHEHYRITKFFDSTTQSMISEVIQLPQSERVHEIARMLGGSEITSKTLAHAEEFLLKQV